MTNMFEMNEMKRRTFLARGGVSLGAAALADLVGGQAGAVGPSVPPASMPLESGASMGLPAGVGGLPNLPPRIKRVIFLCMAGGPSHLETFDEKPELARLHDQPMPASFTEGQPIAQLAGKALKVQGPMTTFQRCGQSGQTISDFLPYHQKMADDLCIVKSMVTEQINHDPAHTFMNTGTAISGRPSMGSWVTYGLGSESSELPGFVVMTSVGGRNPQPIASRQWSAGFLPSRYQGVEFSGTGQAVHYVSPPPGYGNGGQRDVVDAIAKINQKRFARHPDREILTRLSAYEIAFQMQTSVPELVDMSDEPQQILDMYGATPGDGSYASNCLLARRLAERGVRFIQLYHRGWDHHGDLEKYMTVCCKLTDQPTWALIQDLKQRGMLDETLVVWGGEFGRTPMYQGKGGPGRDHHIKGFSMWMAGGGIRGGISYGATDELGYNATEDIVHVRDLHATMLHLLGIRPERFSYPFQGLDMKLTGVEKARVIEPILS